MPAVVFVQKTKPKPVYVMEEGSKYPRPSQCLLPIFVAFALFAQCGARVLRPEELLDQYSSSAPHYSTPIMPPYGDAFAPPNPPPASANCAHPPSTTSPPATVPAPIFTYPSPPPPSPLYFPPPYLGPSPPTVAPLPPTIYPSPPEVTPSPPEIGPSPSPPEAAPSPPEIAPYPSPPEVAPSPPEIAPYPSPPEVTPSPPEIAPSPPEIMPSPPEIVPSPPSYEPSPPSIVPSPPEIVPSPPEIVPSPPGYAPEPPGTFPGPPSFLPPVVFPPPFGPPSPATVSAEWCVAKPSVPGPIIQHAMDYACGSGADCDSIQPDGPCFRPDTMIAHASYAFNSYWQRTKSNGATCDFGGTAMLITKDPSSEGCHYNLM